MGYLFLRVFLFFFFSLFILVTISYMYYTADSRGSDPSQSEKTVKMDLDLLKGDDFVVGGSFLL